MVASLFKAVLHGVGDGDEFSFGFHLAGAAATDEASLAIVLNTWDALMSTDTTPSGWSKLTALLSSDQHYDQVSLYYYALSQDPATFLSHKAVNQVGQGTPKMMLQQASCVTLKTGRNGASYRGRMYIPTTGVIPAANHQIDIGTAGDINEAAQACMEYMKEAIDTVYASNAVFFGVFSQKLNTIEPVTATSCDTRLDVQRRRANRQNIVGVDTSPVASNP
jgi:hypothetical protein